jgi:AcrR family transcriptional regulator
MAIQKEAGVSRGRLLDHFPSRAELLVAASHHLAAERVRDLGSRADWPGGERDRIAAAVKTMWLTYYRPYFWASVELWVAARSHGQLRRELGPEEHIMGALVRSATDSFFGADLIRRPGYPMAREILNTSMRGVVLTYAIEPRDRFETHISSSGSPSQSIYLQWMTLVNPRSVVDSNASTDCLVGAFARGCPSFRSHTCVHRVSLRLSVGRYGSSIWSPRRTPLIAGAGAALPG